MRAEKEEVGDGFGDQAEHAVGGGAKVEAVEERVEWDVGGAKLGEDAGLGAA